MSENYKTFGDLSDAELLRIASDEDENPGGAATARAVLRKRGGAFVHRGEIIGWIRDDQGCENEACLAAIRDGRLFHAIPRVGTLDDYHFATRASAERALVELVERKTIR